MKKRRLQKFLCCLVAISLVWLPFASPAAVYTQNTDTSMSAGMTEPCHTGNQRIKSKSSMNHQVDKTVQAVKICPHCDDNNNCKCADMSACSNVNSHASPFIVFDNQSIESPENFLSDIVYSVQYLNQIITPDYRPPIV